MSANANNVEGVVTVNLPCQYGFLRVARQSVTDFCQRVGLHDYKASQLEMAVDEACANIIEHSYGGEADLSDTSLAHPGLQLNLQQRDGAVVVELIDHGKGFDAELVDSLTPEKYLEQHRTRGLGMYIIRNFVDEMDYTRGTGDERVNTLRLVKFS